MPDFAHIATSFVNDPLASLLLAIPLSFALIALFGKNLVDSWAVGRAAPNCFDLLPRSTSPRARQLLVGLFAFPPLCRDIPNLPLLFRIGIFWFSAFALIAAVIYAAGDRAQHILPIDNFFVDRAPSAAIIKRTT